jgi:peptidoglycan/LPS O-acetylase OafA/YrhL
MEEQAYNNNELYQKIKRADLILILLYLVFIIGSIVILYFYIFHTPTELIMYYFLILYFFGIGLLLCSHIFKLNKVEISKIALKGIGLFLIGLSLIAIFGSTSFEMILYSLITMCAGLLIFFMYKLIE